MRKPNAKEDAEMKSPVFELRTKVGMSKRDLAACLKTNTRQVTEIEEGRRSISLKFKSGFEQMGVNFWDLYIAQKNFLLWRKHYHSALARGLNPDPCSFELSYSSFR